MGAAYMENGFFETSHALMQPTCSNGSKVVRGGERGQAAHTYVLYIFTMQTSVSFTFNTGVQHSSKGSTPQSVYFQHHSTTFSTTDWRNE